MDDLSVRELNSSNFKEIIQVQLDDGFKHAYYLDENRLNTLSLKGEKLFGLFYLDKLIGFAIADVELRARLHFFSINTEYAGKGYGSYFLLEILDILKASNIKQVYCYTEEDSPLDTFLKKHEFEKAGYYKNRFGTGLNANIFERIIN